MRVKILGTYSFVSLSLLFLMTIVTAAPVARALDAGDLINYFVSELTPYGRWSNVSPYGRVWEPADQSRDWRPYSRGHWLYSDEYGWVWQPEESWGEITYHYGRWGHSQNRWFWVPDQTWGPAWVDWRSTNDYVGWAPLSPEEDWRWDEEWHPRHSYYSSLPSAYVFMPQRDFGRSDVRKYSISPERNRDLLIHAQEVGIYRTHDRHVRNERPRRELIESATGHRIVPAHYQPHSINGRNVPRTIEQAARPIDQDRHDVQETSNIAHNRAHEENRNKMIEANRREAEARNRVEPPVISHEHQPNHERDAQVTRERQDAQARVQNQKHAQSHPKAEGQNTNHAKSQTHAQPHASAEVASPPHHNDAKPKHQGSAKQSDIQVDQTKSAEQPQAGAEHHGKNAHADKNKKQGEKDQKENNADANH